MNDNETNRDSLIERCARVSQWLTTNQFLGKLLFLFASATHAAGWHVALVGAGDFKRGLRRQTAKSFYVKSEG